MGGLRDDDGLLDIYCPAPHSFRIAINCRSSTDGYIPNGPEVPEEVKNICCLSKPSDYGDSLLKCCEAFEDSDFNHPQSGWDSGSYQAYVMGVAVVAILLCLFISGARSVRKRRMMILRERQRRALGGPNATLSNVRSQDPPTYGELEASGLTKDLKSELLPPSYSSAQIVAYDDCTVVSDNRQDQVSNGPMDSTESMEPPPYTPK